MAKTKQAHDDLVVPDDVENMDGTPVDHSDDPDKENDPVVPGDDRPGFADLKEEAKVNVENAAELLDIDVNLPKDEADEKAEEEKAAEEDDYPVDEDAELIELINPDTGEKTHVAPEQWLSNSAVWENRGFKRPGQVRTSLTPDVEVHQMSRSTGFDREVE